MLAELVEICVKHLGSRLPLLQWVLELEVGICRFRAKEKLFQKPHGFLEFVFDLAQSKFYLCVDAEMR